MTLISTHFLSFITYNKMLMDVERGLLGIVWILFVLQLSEIPRCHGKMSCLSWWSSSYEMWSSGYEGTFPWDGRVSFLLWEMASLSLSSSTFPHSCGWTRTSPLTHTHTHTYSRHTSRSHSPSFIHTKAYTYALTNTNCSHFTVIWTDMFTLLLIWMSPHCLASFLLY